LRALVQDERRAWHLLLGNGIPVDVGRGNLDARVARLSRVYPKVLAPRAVHIRRIDLRYTNGFAVAWKRSSPDG
jgi:cell division protein FtsQ